MGDGRMGSLLSYDKWAHLANAQRAHQNYVEDAAGAAMLILINGFFNPCFAAAAGFVYIIGRQLYAMGYRSGGPKGRLAGTIIFSLAFLALFFNITYRGLAFTGILDSVLGA